MQTLRYSCFTEIRCELYQYYKKDKKIANFYLTQTFFRYFIFFLKNKKKYCIIQMLQNNEIITIVLNVYYNLINYIDIFRKKYKIYNIEKQKMIGVI